MSLFLFRHGETLWNVEKRQQGRKDSPLTEKALRQARELAGHAKGWGLARILSSPLGRARETAAVLGSALGIEPREDPRLAECSFGDFEGLLWSEIRDRHREVLAARDRDPWAFRWPGGESYRDVSERVSGLLAELSREPARGNLALVGHETVNRAILGKLLDLEPGRVVKVSHPNAVVYRVSGPEAHRFDAADPGSGWIAGLLFKGGAGEAPLGTRREGT